jgi:hypothetical protein
VGRTSTVRDATVKVVAVEAWTVEMTRPAGVDLGVDA